MSLAISCQILQSSDNLKSHSTFLFHKVCIKCFPIKVTGENNPNGSNMDAIVCNTSLLVLDDSKVVNCGTEIAI